MSKQFYKNLQNIDINKTNFGLSAAEAEENLTARYVLELKTRHKYIKCVIKYTLKCVSFPKFWKKTRFESKAEAKSQTGLVFASSVFP